MNIKTYDEYFEDFKNGVKKVNVYNLAIITLDLLKLADAIESKLLTNEEIKQKVIEILHRIIDEFAKEKSKKELNRLVDNAIPFTLDSYLELMKRMPVYEVKRSCLIS